MVVAPMHVWELSLSPYMKLKVTLECSSVLKKRGGGLKRAKINAYISGFCKAAGKRHLCKQYWVKPFAGSEDILFCRITVLRC